MPCVEARLQILTLLLVFVSDEDLLHLLSSLGRVVGVRHSDIEHRSAVPLPKSFHRHIAAEFRQHVSVLGRRSAVPTGVDDRFVGDSTGHGGGGAKVMPFAGKFVVALGYQTPLFAVEGVFHGEPPSAAVADGGEVVRGEAVPKV